VEDEQPRRLAGRRPLDRDQRRRRVGRAGHQFAEATAVFSR
jgi:hypothetical protein